MNIWLNIFSGNELNRIPIFVIVEDQHELGSSEKSDTKN